ncbi:ATP-binding protein [Streptomyces qinzhouensis]|uniref:ATP-binding protein n=1 Tax=Streptomyces qinzhouensis TaxID=2599401 RepID=UPI0016442558|nr:ATP-binding protein [Streptomyces qinzhouensis]
MNRASSGGSGGAPRAPRDPAVESFAHPAPAPVRTTPVVAGDFLLTVNPLDGSEIVLRPPGGAPADQNWPAPPERRTAAERAAHERAGAPPVPSGPALPRPALAERDEVRERLTRLLGRGRSVRLTGPPGSGRTALLDLVAQDCAGLAPDGVIRLNGLHRTAGELLHALFAAVHRSERHRPDRAALLAEVARIGAVVVLDDFDGPTAALTELLDAAPECAFLIAAAPAPPEPGDEPHGPRIDEAELEGLSRAGALGLLARLVDRDLTEDERNWAGDLWFESEGLPLRFVQAGALLRQSDELRVDPETAADASPFEGTRTTAVRLPTLGQGAAPAALLASRLSESARETLRLAVALGGEVPHQAHLPALIDDTHADSALGELTACGLLSPAGPRYRLAPGALDQLKEKGYGPDPGTDGTGAVTDRAHTAARHYAWWTAHPSVTAERVVVEADAVLAALAALLTGRVPGRLSTAVRLARAAAPVFAAGLHWAAWESALRMGSEAARIAGEVAEEAYFHHELGVLALCTDNLGRARAELEASIGLRGALADKNGTVAGRRALALVTDREKRPADGAAGAVVPAPRAIGPGGPAAPRLVPVPAPVPPALPVPAPRGFRKTDDDEVAARLGPRPVELAGPPVRAALPPGAAAISEPLTVPEVLATAPYPQQEPRRRRRGLLLGGARRNLVAAGAGAVLVAVLGTVLTFTPASEEQDPPGTRVDTGDSVPDEDLREDGPPAAEPAPQDDPVIGDPTRQPSRTPSPGPSASPSASASREPGRETSRPPQSPSPEDPPPSRSTPPKPSDSGGPSPSDSPDPSDSATPPESPGPSESESSKPPTAVSESASDAAPPDPSVSGTPAPEPDSGSPSAG